MKTDELKWELATVIAYQQRLIDEFADTTNKRNQSERERLIESRNTFQAVLDRLNGGPSLALYY
jgi:hypothetical protein